MQVEFEMSMMGELNYLLGLQINQFQHGTFLSQAKYCRQLLEKFDMENYKEAATPIANGCYLDVDGKGANVDQTKIQKAYRITSLSYCKQTRYHVQRVSMCKIPSQS